MSRVQIGFEHALAADTVLLYRHLARAGVDLRNVSIPLELRRTRERNTVNVLQMLTNAVQQTLPGVAVSSVMTVRRGRTEPYQVHLSVRAPGVAEVEQSEPAFREAMRNAAGTNLIDILPSRLTGTITISPQVSQICGESYSTGFRLVHLWSGLSAVCRTIESLEPAAQEVRRLRRALESERRTPGAAMR